MKVRVEQRHIKAGRRHDPCRCPIALAVWEELPTECPEVADGFVFMGGHEYMLTVEACTFVHRFDRGEMVEPFEFELRTDDSAEGGEK